MRELSVFIGESGSDGLADRYYLLTLVFHEQESGIAQSIARYQHALVMKDLPDIPFHASPLLNGHGGYEGMDIACRKRLFSTFRVFFRATLLRRAPSSQASACRAPPAAPAHRCPCPPTCARVPLPARGGIVACQVTAGRRARP